jgi:hypothetical protein
MAAEDSPTVLGWPQCNKRRTFVTGDGGFDSATVRRLTQKSVASW